MCRKEDHHWHRQRWKVVSCQYFKDIANMLTFNVGQRRFTALKPRFILRPWSASPTSLSSAVRKSCCSVGDVQLNSPAIHVCSEFRYNVLINIPNEALRIDRHPKVAKIWYISAGQWKIRPYLMIRIQLPTNWRLILIPAQWRKYWLHHITLIQACCQVR